MNIEDKYEPNAVTAARERLYKSNIKNIDYYLDDLLKQTTDALNKELEK